MRTCVRNIRSARAYSARHGSYFLLGTRLDVHHTGYIPQQRARRGVLCGASEEDYGSDWSYYDDSFESGQGPRSIVGRHATNHHPKPKAYATYGAMYGSFSWFVLLQTLGIMMLPLRNVSTMGLLLFLFPAMVSRIGMSAAKVWSLKPPSDKVAKASVLVKAHEQDTPGVLPSSIGSSVQDRSQWD
jgi:hypothetical protein